MICYLAADRDSEGNELPATKEEL